MIISTCLTEPDPSLTTEQFSEHVVFISLTHTALELSTNFWSEKPISGYKFRTFSLRSGMFYAHHGRNMLICRK